MLSGISTVCFLSSYSVALLLEISRLFFRVPIRVAAIYVFTLAGLFAHTVYLTLRAQDQLSTGAPLSSWYDWCLLGAWILTAAYVGLASRRPQNAIGVFLLPLVLGLIGLGLMLRDAAPFAREEALSIWRMVHGITLLMGTVGVALGFASGVMYLVQSYRLKHKVSPVSSFKLPSLEWLQRFNRETVYVSTALLALGLLSGIVMNLGNADLANAEEATVPWTDLGVISSGVLFLWMVAVSAFESLYKPARQGRKVAYLTLASFIFLGLTLAFILLGDHTSAAASRSGARGSQSVAPLARSGPCPFAALAKLRRAPSWARCRPGDAA